MDGGAERQRVVIVGGGTAGWMAAAVVARFVPTAAVTLVESAEIGAVGVGEATIPQLRRLNALLGLDEDRFVQATEGSFKLGIRFEGWGTPDGRYLHAFGRVGQAVGMVPFHQLWLRHVQAGGTAGLWDFSPTARAAAADRFGRVEDADGAVAWAFHFDAGRYARLLRSVAELAGATRVEGRIVGVERAADGEVAAVRLADGQAIAGDLFLDCSGFRSLLLADALGEPWEDWSRWLPCDRALAVPSARGPGPLTPYTRAVARGAGWQWRIPLQHRTGNGLVYCSAEQDDDAAAATLLAGLDGAPLADPRPLRFRAGRRRRAWTGNVVALGLAAGFLEPLESTSIHLVQSGLSRLLQLWPGVGIADADRAEFNRQTAEEWEGVRDFLALHYHLNGRAEPLWRQLAATSPPDAAAERLGLFRANGRLFRRGEELFTEAGWLQLFVGQGVRPAGHAPLADALPPAELDRLLAGAAARAAALADAMPDHAAFVARRTAPRPQEAA